MSDFLSDPLPTSILMCVSSESSGETVQRHRLAWALAGRLCDKYHNLMSWLINSWAASSEFGTYRLCEQRRFRRDCASAQSRQNLRCSLIQAVSQEEPSDRKPDPWPLWMTGHVQSKFVMTECSKTNSLDAAQLVFVQKKKKKKKSLWIIPCGWNVVC